MPFFKRLRSLLQKPLVFHVPCHAAADLESCGKVHSIVDEHLQGSENSRGFHSSDEIRQDGHSDGEPVKGHFAVFCAQVPDKNRRRGKQKDKRKYEMAVHKFGNIHHYPDVQRYLRAHIFKKDFKPRQYDGEQDHDAHNSGHHKDGRVNRGGDDKLPEFLKCGLVFIDFQEHGGQNPSLFPGPDDIDVHGRKMFGIIGQGLGKRFALLELTFQLAGEFPECGFGTVPVHSP